ncbi:MAG TPA: TolC family protein [Blastocatellia bacterium]|nr:TolC family protein [Blastocatellia bacterium]
MKTKIHRGIAAALLLLTAFSSAALPQSVNDQDALGVVLADKPAKPVAAAQSVSSYPNYIDQTNGLSADELVRYALLHNGELAAARQMIAEARGRLRQAGQRPNPMVEASGSQAVTSRDNNLTIGAELPLELGGRRSARINVAEREIELRQAEVSDFERRLAAEVRMKYAEAIAAARNLSFAEELLALTRDSHRLIQARVERGKSAPLEQNQVFVEVNRVDAMRITFEGKTEAALFELRKTLGMPPTEPLRLRGEFNADQQPSPQGDALRSALASRPDLAAAKAAEALAQAQIEQARTEGKVDASLFANYMRQSMGFGVNGINDAGALAPVEGVFHYATFGLRLTLPVRNKNQGAIEAAVAASEAARSRREFNEVVIRNEVAAAYARFERARAALTVYREGVRVPALRNLDVIRQVYTLGQKTLIDYVAEQRRYIDVETAFTDVLKEYYDALVEIQRAAGIPVPTV